MRKACIIAMVGFIIVQLSIAISGLAAEPKINLQTLLANRVPILLEFGRGWCIPCKYMKPILDDMARAYMGRTIVLTVDMDANKDLVRSFKVRMMPTQVFLMPDGKEFLRNEGTLEREQIIEIFSKMGVQPPMIQGAPPAQAVPQAAAPQALPAIPGGARW
jgi:thioredoxin 1